MNLGDWVAIIGRYMVLIGFMMFIGAPMCWWAWCGIKRLFSSENHK